MYKEFGIKDEVLDLSKKVEKDISSIIDDVNKRCEINSCIIINFNII